MSGLEDKKARPYSHFGGAASESDEGSRDSSMAADFPNVARQSNNSEANPSPFFTHHNNNNNSNLRSLEDEESSDFEHRNRSKEDSISNNTLMKQVRGDFADS